MFVSRSSDTIDRAISTSRLGTRRENPGTPPGASSSGGRGVNYPADSYRSTQRGCLSPPSRVGCCSDPHPQADGRESLAPAPRVWLTDILCIMHLAAMWNHGLHERQYNYRVNLHDAVSANRRAYH